MTIHAPSRTASAPAISQPTPETGAASATFAEIRYRHDAVTYVAAMLAELRQIAEKAGLDRLVKSIEAAYYEAHAARDAKAPEAAPAPRATLQRGAQEKTSNPMEPNGT